MDRTPQDKSVKEYVKPNIKAMIGVFAIKTIVAVSELLIPMILSMMIDDIAPTENIPKLFLYGGFMIICALSALTGNITANRLSSKIANRITYKIRRDVYKKTINLTCKKADEFTVPTLISRLTSDTYNFQNMLLCIQRIGIRAPILAIGGIGVSMFLDVSLTMVLLIVMPIAFVTVFIVSRRGIGLFSDVQKGSDRMVGVMRENMEGIRVIKALSKSEYEREKFRKISGNIYDKERKASIITGISGPIMSLLLNFGLTAVILVGAYRVHTEAAAPGVIVAFLSYFQLILNSMMMINRIFMQLSKGIASAKRLDEVLLSETDDDCIESEKIETPYHIIFDDVSFSYLNAKNNVEHISFRLKQGQTLGIIGATGSGKSTIVNLLLRFYEAGSGKIFINGEDIRSIPRERLYSMFGSALQTDFLMSDTIEENIVFCRDIDEDEAMKAAINALANPFISEKKDGYMHKLDVKAANLSGGQKQRLLISRSLASNPEILILDDSCGGLDYKTDSELRSNLAENYSHATKIIVAQRISTIKNADEILVIDEGKIIGQGSHTELMETCDAYKETAQAQMEL